MSHYHVLHGRGDKRKGRSIKVAYHVPLGTDREKGGCTLRDCLAMSNREFESEVPNISPEELKLIRLGEVVETVETHPTDKALSKEEVIERIKSRWRELRDGALVAQLKNEYAMAGVEGNVE